MTNYTKYKLGDLVEKITKGTTPSTLGGGFVESGINFIKSEAIGYDGRIDKSTFVKIDEETHEKLKRSQLQVDDILFSMAGIFLGKNAIVTADILPANTNQALAIIRLNKGITTPKYVHYFLRQKDVIKQVNSMSGQSAQPNINFEEIKSIQIAIPDLEVQNKVTQILSSLDDKIELNLQMNQTLEAMAQAIFKEWFVNFNFPGFDGVLQNGLPKQWRLGSVLEIAKLLSGGTPKTEIQEYWNGDIGWISAKDITSNNGRFILETEKLITSIGIEKSAAKLLPPYTTIISARGTVGNYCILFKEMAISQSNYGLKSINDKNFFLFVLIENMIEMMKAFSYGTVFDTITTKTFQEMEITIPDENVIDKYEETVKPIFEKILDNQKNIQSLTQIRDSLLPKLMTGKIEIKN